MSRNISHTVAALIAASLAMPTAALAQSSTTLPSLGTQNAIESLAVEPKSTTLPQLREFTVDRDKGFVTLPNVADQGRAKAPLLVPNAMVLQFQPNASKESIDNLLKERNLKVIETFPKLGAVKVETDLSKYFAPDLQDDNANQALLRGVNKAIADFKNEPIVRNATPDVVFRSQSNSQELSNITTGTASEVGPLALVEKQEVVDWGIGNIEADQLWNLPGAQDGVLFGVMDVGFARHEDITFLELPNKTIVDDHGNHVAAIGCGRHDNGRGIRGVLPNCFVRARTPDIHFQSSEQVEPVFRFFVIFSQVIGTFEKFLSQTNDIRVFNLSLGYNFVNQFNINPDLPASPLYRVQVENQGGILITALELADKAGKMIFSAAGNDSFGLTQPVGAKFASPFNWAALTAREKGIARNGVIVEAHDSSNKRAPFSNVGGHISCPGVNILSAVAFDSSKNRSQSLYGKMSGTSMASPYCAAAHLLLGLVRPGYTGSELLDCLLASTEKSDSGAPIPKLTQALAKCPAREQG